MSINQPLCCHIFQNQYPHTHTHTQAYIKFRKPTSRHPLISLNSPNLYTFPTITKRHTHTQEQQQQQSHTASYVHTAAARAIHKTRRGAHKNITQQQRTRSRYILAIIKSTENYVKARARTLARLGPWHIAASKVGRPAPSNVYTLMCVCVCAAGRDMCTYRDMERLAFSRVN